MLIPAAFLVLPYPFTVASPIPPTALIATAYSADRIDLAWLDNSTDEDGFQILRSNSPTGPWSEIAKAAPNARRYSDLDLTASTTYYYILRATSDLDVSGFSNLASAMTSSGAGLSAPTDLAAVPSSTGGIVLSWSDTSDDEDGFQIIRSTSAIGDWFEIQRTGRDTTTYTDTDVVSGTTYYYAVRAFAGGLSSTFTNVASAASSTTEDVPVAPSDLAAVAISAVQINLFWSDNSDNESGFRIERASRSSGPWGLLAVTGQNSVGYVDTLLSPSSTYYYRVSAYSALGTSESTNVVSATTFPEPPEAPSNLSATASSSSQIDLRWTDNSTDESGFRIERWSGASWNQIGAVGPNATSFSNVALSPSTTYYYRVASYNAGGAAYSPFASALTPANVTVPSSPQELTAAAASTSQILLTWTDTSANETGFVLERATSASGPFSQIATTTSASYTDSGLTGATTYFYRARAYNTAGPSAYSNIDSATTLGSAPAAPTNLTATATSPSQVALTWTDNSTNETGFAVERSTSATGPFSQIATTAASSVLDIGLTASTTYYYRVRAYNTTGPSAYSNVDSATTLGSAPAAPTNLTATATSSSQIVLSWMDNSSNETYFIVERATSASGPFAQIVTPTSPSYTDTGLAAGTTYFYRVRAHNAAGSSAYSNIGSATTSGGIPAAPTNLVASATSSSQIVLTWSDNSTGETGFVVERGSSASGPFAQIATTASPSYTNTGLNAVTTYFYRVHAYNASGASANSNVAFATTSSGVPNAPSSLTATATSPRQISLTWTDNSTSETGFKIERAPAVSGPFSTTATTGPGVTAYSDSGLNPLTTYVYRVRAFNTAGDSSASNSASATTPQGLDTIAPSMPETLDVTAPSCGTTRLEWARSTDTGGSGLKGYNIYRKGIFLRQIPASAPTSMIDSGLPSAVFYHYEVSAVDNAGNESDHTSPVGTYTQSCAGSGGDYRWARTFGGSLSPDGGQAIAVDRDGSIFVTGDFNDTADFGGEALTSAGYRDVFVAKYRADGRHVWSRAFGGAYDDFGKGIAVDANGDVVISGLFLRTANFGGAPLTSAGGYDTFVVKLSGLDGAHIWSKRLGGTSDDRSAALTIDGANNVVLTGQFNGAADFGNGVTTGSSTNTRAYLAKYSGTNGAYQWARVFDSVFGAGQGIAIDGNDNLFVTGYFQGSVNFGGGTLASAGGLDIFVAKFTSSGAHVWSRSFGDESDQHGQAVGVDSAGNVILAGDFQSSVDFGGGPLVDTYTTQTIFLASLGPDGSHRWSKSFTADGLNGGSFAYGLAIDGSDRIVLTGIIAGPVDFGGGPLGVSTIFLAKFSDGGAHLWSKSYRSGGGAGRAVATAPDGSILATGSFTTVVDLGGGEVRSNGSASSDAFLLSLAP